MAAPRVTGKIELLAIVFVAIAAVGGDWANGAEFSAALLPPEAQALTAEAVASGPVADEDMASYYVPSGPVWYFSADALAMKRDGADNLAFASLVTRTWTDDNAAAIAEAIIAGNPPPPSAWSSTQAHEVVLGTGDLDFGYRGGWSAMIGRTIGDFHAAEVSYFSLSDSSDMETVIDQTPFQFLDPIASPSPAPPSLFSPFTDLTGDPASGLDLNNLASISYSSRLYGLEWNLRRQLFIPEHWVQGSVLVGGRYMELREDFLYYSESPFPGPADTTNSINTLTKNEMVGVQVGAEFNFQVEPRCWIDCGIKGGVFDNAARQDTVYVHQGVAAYNGTHLTGRSENTSTFALDLALDLTYEANSFTTLRIGYQALWIDGLALAAENVFHPNMLVSGASNIVNDGKVVYHGPRLGITCAW